LKTRDRVILFASLSACVICFIAWMIINYDFSKPQDAPIFQSGSGIPAHGPSPNAPLSPNSNDEIPPEVAEKFSESKELDYLKLVGTAVNSNNAPCAVIDNTKTQSQALYKKGDKIDDADILEIQSDSVILARNGKHFKLILEKSTSPETQLKTDELLQETPNPFIYTTQEDVEKAWDETQDLMTMIELEQHFENGEPKGVRIEKVNPDTVFEKIGFKAGDILIQVDDMKMSIADDAMEVYNCIRTRPTVHFTIIREGESSPLILEYTRGMH
jgi:type II secretion system protein C